MKHLLWLLLMLPLSLYILNEDYKTEKNSLEQFKKLEREFKQNAINKNRRTIDSLIQDKKSIVLIGHSYCRVLNGSESYKETKVLYCNSVVYCDTFGRILKIEGTKRFNNGLTEITIKGVVYKVLEIFHREEYRNAIVYLTKKNK